MDDRALVAALIAGDQRGLEGAYRTYADRLFTYCRGMLRDPDAAADAVHDTFVIASQRAHQLREPDRLRSWLYAIARNECLRLLRGRARQVPLAEVGEMSAPEHDPVEGLRAAEVQELVWAAAEGLNQGDREVFELTVRHDLPAAEVGALLGLSTAHAHARLSRARAQLERGLGALLVARTGTADGPSLAELLAGWDGRLTALIRKRVSRHIAACEVCAERQRRQLRPAALFSAYAAAPWLLVPAELWPRLQRTSFAPEWSAARDGIAQRAGRFTGAHGFPRALEPPRRRLAVAGVAAAVVVLLAVAGAGVNLLNGAEPAGEPVAGPAASSGPALATVSPAPAPEPSAAPVPTAPAGSPVAGPPGAATGPPITAPSAPGASPSPSGPAQPLPVEAQVLPRCAQNGGYALAVVAEAGAALAEAAVWVQPRTQQPVAHPLTISGNGAQGVVNRLQGPVTWWVEVTAVDGRYGATAPAALPSPCQ